MKFLRTKLTEIIDSLLDVFKSDTNEGKQLRQLKKKYTELWNDAAKSETVDNGEGYAILEKGRKHNYNIGEYVEGEQLVQLKSYNKHLVNDVDNYYVVDDDGIVLSKYKNNARTKKILSMVEEEYNGTNATTNETTSNYKGVESIEDTIGTSTDNPFGIGEQGWIDRYFYYLSENYKSEGTNGGENNKSFEGNEGAIAPFNNEQYSISTKTQKDLEDNGYIYNGIIPSKNLTAPEGYTILYHNTTANNLGIRSKSNKLILRLFSKKQDNLEYRFIFYKISNKC